MAFDGITVAALTHELSGQLTNGRIAKIAQPEADELLLTVKLPQGQKRLYLSASASLPLLYLTQENKPSPMTAPNFCMLLRKHIGGGRIVGVTQPGLERIVVLEIEHLDEMGDLRRKKLIAELMGKHSNIIFCDSDDTIIDSIKHVSAQMSSVREVLPGRTYFIPDTMGKIDPLTVEEAAFAAALREKPAKLSKAIYTSFTGISPVVAEDICALAGLDSDQSARELSETECVHLYRQFSYYMEDVRERAFEPMIYESPDGTPAEFGAKPLFVYRGMKKRRFASMSEMLFAYYATKNVTTRIRQKSANLRHIVQTALARNRKKYGLQEKQLRDTEGRERCRIYGELIQAYGYDLLPEARVLTCPDYHTGKEVTIPLDPTRTPQENAQKYFARYNKQKRTYEALCGLIRETADEIDYLESIGNALDIAQDEDDLTQIKDELVQSGYVRRRPAKKKVRSKSRPLHYISGDGYHIYVGKNNLQNDELTFSFASGNDWWFHAKKTPGSHVIVKADGDTLPDATFEDAGRLAAYYSKKRGSDKVEVDYVEKKHVKKPNGAKPGFVVYYTNYSLVIDSDISHIQQIEE